MVKFNIGSKTEPKLKKPKVEYTSTKGDKKKNISIEVEKIKTLDDLSGQDNLRTLLKLKAAAFKSGRPIGHWLFTGPSGLGKTTFARAFINELGVKMHLILGNKIRSWADISAILLSMKTDEVVFIDEIHALKPMFQNNLYDVMAEGKFNEVNRNGVQTFVLPQISVFGATTHQGHLNEALKNRFRNIGTMVPYSFKQLTEMIKGDAKFKYNINFPDNVASSMANLVQGTPRRAEGLIENLIDVTAAHGSDINIEALHYTLKLMNLDPYLGLDLNYRNYLFTLDKIDSMGRASLSDHIGEEEETVQALEKFLFSRLVVKDLKIDGPLVMKSSGRSLTENGKLYVEAIRALKNQGWFPDESWK